MKPWRLFFPLLFLFCFVFLKSASAVTKTFYFPRVEIRITVQNDGSFDVDEARTYSFSGSFSRVYWDIPIRRFTAIEQVKMIEQSGYSPKNAKIYYIQIPQIDESRPIYKFAVEQQASSYHIEAYHSSTDVTKTFDLQYKVVGGIKKYQDVAELYWQAIGSGWDARTDSATVTISLPQETTINNIYVWGHGPLNGQAKIIDGKSAQFTAVNLPADQMMEVRMAFPSTMISGTPIAQNGLPQIKQEELQFQKDTQFKQQLKLIGLIGIMVLIGGWIALWLVIWERVGREYKNVSVPEYLQFPPETISPSMVEALLSQEQTVSGNSFSAEILYLAKKGYLKIEAQEYYTKGILGLGSHRDYHYIIHFMSEGKTRESLLSSEQMVYEFVHGQAQGSEISIDDLKEAMKNDRSGTYAFYKGWIAQVKKEADQSNFVEDKSKKWRWIFTISSVAILWIVVFGLGVIFGGGFLVASFSVVIYGSIFGAMIFYFIGHVFLRWTKDAETEAQKWLAFKHYLEESPRFKKELPQAVTIWDYILIYGTALGIAQTVAKYLPLILSQPNVHATSGWFYYTSSGGSPISSVSGMDINFATSFSQSLSSMVTSFSSSFSSGAGGGLSGGGGGGGGGAD